MKRTRIAISIHNHRVSPLFDVADNFIIFEVNNNMVIKEYFIDTSDCSENRIVDRLSCEGVDVIICSAIHRCLADRIVNERVFLISGIVGSIDEVIKAFLNNNLIDDEYTMPGSGKKSQVEDKYRMILLPQKSKL